VANAALKFEFTGEEIMSKPEWGEKHLCPSCGTLYYDMLKTPATCPKCNTAYDPEALLKSRRKVDIKRVEEVEEEVEDEIEIDEDVIADDVPEDDIDDGEEIEVNLEEEE
jgi:uncharacterized protein (TIGR02300 family)